MGFLDKLAANPSGSGIYNSSGPQNVDFGPTLSAINQLKDREMNDYKQKAQFNQELSLRQPRLQQIYAPPGSRIGNLNQGQPDVVFGGEDKSGALPTPMQQEGINQNKQEMGLQEQKLAQQSKFGDQKIAQMQATHDLNKQKSDQIFQTKQADMQRKVDEANNKLGFAYDQLNQKGNNADTLAAIKQAQIDSQKAQMELMNHHHTAQLEELKIQHAATNKHLQDQLDETKANNKAKLNAAGQPTTEVKSQDASGAITTTKTKGSNTIRVIHPDGRHGVFPANQPLPEGFSLESDAATEGK